MLWHPIKENLFYQFWTVTKTAIVIINVHKKMNTYIGEYFYEKLLEAKLLVLRGQVLLTGKTAPNSDPSKWNETVELIYIPTSYVQKCFFLTSYHCRYYQPFRHLVQLYASWREAIHYPSFGLLCCLVHRNYSILFNLFLFL